MEQFSIQLQKVTYGYDTMVTPLFSNVSLSFGVGWTGVVGANGAGKTTILKLLTGELAPLSGQIGQVTDSLYCTQKTDTPPDELQEMITNGDNDAYRIIGQLEIGNDWADRWDSLSHGERKRAQIGLALWRRPRVLAIDEPTNHLDSRAKALLFDALGSFNGIGALVSHDRELLDTLCYQCVFVDPPDVITRSGNYTAGSLQMRRELDNLRESYNLKKQVYQKLRQETSKRRDSAAQSHHKRSKKGLALKDHDARFKKNLVRISGKDGTGGKLLNQMSGRIRQAKEELEAIKVKKEYQTGIWLSGEKCRKAFLIRLSEEQIPLGCDRYLSIPEMNMKADDRIAITGNNGSGKSTLIQHLLPLVAVSNDRLVFIPQEISSQESIKILKDIKTLRGESLGRMMTVVNRLGSRPERLLESENPSPGEIRKLKLALGISKAPHLIIMDEPTNHMDLPSIESLEKALMDCPCGMILVSHDRVFLKKLTSTHWHIGQPDKDSGNTELQIIAY